MVIGFLLFDHKCCIHICSCMCVLLFSKQIQIISPRKQITRGNSECEYSPSFSNGDTDRGGYNRIPSSKSFGMIASDEAIAAFSVSRFLMTSRIWKCILEKRPHLEYKALTWPERLFIMKSS